MDRERIFATVKQIVLDVLPDVAPEAVTLSASLRELGGNSIDRAEVATRAMEQLDIVLPFTELARVGDLGGLVDLLHRASEPDEARGRRP
jgi:polyketide biosynthesis acyl carrier protein